MLMTPGLRKAALSAHVTSSVGWMGAVASFLALAVAGLTSENAQLVRSVYLVMELTTWLVIVPLSIASLLTGLVQSLGTEWGLVKHYWVFAKLLIAVLATIILLVHTQPIGQVASLAAVANLADSELRPLRVQLVADAVGAIIALLVATVLSVYKPRGVTRFGRPNASPERAHTHTPRWVYVARIIAVVLAASFLIAHLAGRGLHGH